MEQYRNKLQSYAHQEHNREPFINFDFIFMSHYCRIKIGSPEVAGYEEDLGDIWELIPNHEKLRYLHDPSYEYDITKTNYTKEDLKTLCKYKFIREPSI